MNIGELVELGQQLRVDSVRAAAAAGSGHPTSSMSAADLMAVLLARHFRYDFDRPEHPGNDRFVLSKGHASPSCTPRSRRSAPSTTRNSSPSASSAAASKAIPPPAAALGRDGHRVARPGTAGRRRHRAGREAARPLRLPGVGDVRGQRTGRGLGVGGRRARRVREPRQPDRPRGREPARPARPHPARPRPRRVRPPLRGLRLARHGGGRARRRRRRPGVRGGVLHQGAADRDPRPHPQGQGRRGGAGPRGDARQAAAGCRRGDRRTRRPPRPAREGAGTARRPRAARRAHRAGRTAPVGQGREGGDTERLR